jgi:UDP-glucose 4-epimerase
VSTQSGRVAVVGARGFLGSQLVASSVLASRGLDSYTSQTPVVQYGELARPMLETRTVYWVASTCTPAVASADPTAVENDLRAFREFLSLVGRLKSPPRIILASSGGTVYSGIGRPPYSEQSQVLGTTPYARLKLAMEDSLTGYAGESLVLRLSNPYGPGQPARKGQGVIPYWCQAIAEGRDPVIFGDATVARDYIYIADAVEAFLASLFYDMSSPFEIFNIGSGVPVSLEALSSIFSDQLGVTARREKGRSFDVGSTWLDVALARERLNWRASTPLDVGIARTLERWGLRK